MICATYGDKLGGWNNNGHWGGMRTYPTIQDCADGMADHHDHDRVTCTTMGDLRNLRDRIQSHTTARIGLWEEN
ncbi:MAG TPA: hypothetical protein PKM73_14445 [Verrucomicrobiota bacterium]|nr:hypothetical protein [Verrucomicrobiota bacterium]